MDIADPRFDGGNDAAARKKREESIKEARAPGQTALDDTKIWGFASFMPKEDKFEECQGLLQTYASQTHDNEPGALRVAIYAQARSEWLWGQRFREAYGIISIHEEFASFEAYKQHENGAARSELNAALVKGDVAEFHYGEVVPCGGFPQILSGKG